MDLIKVLWSYDLILTQMLEGHSKATGAINKSSFSIEGQLNKVRIILFETEQAASSFYDQVFSPDEKRFSNVTLTFLTLGQPSVCSVIRISDQLVDRTRLKLSFTRISEHAVSQICVQMEPLTQEVFGRVLPDVIIYKSDFVLPHLMES